MLFCQPNVILSTIQSASAALKLWDSLVHITTITQNSIAYATLLESGKLWDLRRKTQNFELAMHFATKLSTHRVAKCNKHRLKKFLKKAYIIFLY